MASLTCNRTKTATLSTTTVDTLTMGTKYDGVEVENLSGTSAIAFTLDGTVPVVDADEMFHVEPGEALKVPCNTFSGLTTVVKLIGSGNKYRVNGIVLMGGEI